MKVFYLVLICSLPYISIAQSCDKMNGQWVNELGSVLQIDSISNDGSILGIYKSSTGVDGKIFPLQGWINSHDDHQNEINISFTVRWTGYGSITAWTGYCHSFNDFEQIKTVWHLVRSGKDYDWERIISNSSTFKPLETE